jgi:hypothetical protein
MSDAADREPPLRVELLQLQIRKVRFDMDMESKKYRLQTATLLVSIAAAIIAAFAAGHFIR